MSAPLNRFFTGKPVPGRALLDIAWHGRELAAPPWQEANGRLLRFTMAAIEHDEEDLHVILNMSDDAVDVALPSITTRCWHLALDTSRRSPGDILRPEEQRKHEALSLSAPARSMLVLEARPLP